MEKTTEREKNRLLYPILLFLVIAIQLAVNTYTFAVKKTAYHEDENLSYGLANSYYRPFLYGSALQVPDAYDEWMSGKDFYDYERTDENDRFRFDSVWSNMADEVHPPLYYSIIHLISSVFTGSFSWWYAYSVNVIAFVVSQIFLYLLAILLTRSKPAAIAVCAFWGATLAGQSNFVFLRNYSLLTMFTIMYAYLSFALMEKEKLRKRDCAAIVATVFCGALTQHFFLVAAFGITALEGLWLLFKKSFRKAFAYGFSALAGVALSCAAFPATFAHLKSDRIEYSRDPSFSAQRRQFSDLIFNGLLGVEAPRFDGAKYAGLFLLLGLLLCAPLAFLFRNEAWMKKFAAKLKKLPSASVKAAKALPKTDPRPAILLLSSLLLFIVVAATVYYGDFKEQCDRYFFAIEPLIVAAAAAIFAAIARRIGKPAAKRAFCAVITAAFAGVIVFQNVKKDPDYVFSASPVNGTVDEAVSGSSCVLVARSSIYLPCFCRMLENADDIYVTIFDEERYLAPENLAEYKKLADRGETFYVVADTSRFYSDDEIKEREELLKAKEAGKPITGDASLLVFYDETANNDYFMKLFEDATGFKGEYVTTETTHGFVKMSVFRFSPQ